jgi:hypothetical protein
MSDRPREVAAASRKQEKKCDNTHHMSIWVIQAFAAVFTVYPDDQPSLNELEDYDCLESG